MKDLKLTADEVKAEYGECAPCSSGEDDGPKYPWGLQLCLDQGTLTKLGIGLIPVGSKVVIMAEAQVVGTSSRERIKGERREDMDLQLTAMDLSLAARDVMGSAASKLYPQK